MLCLWTKVWQNVVSSCVAYETAHELQAYAANAGNALRSSTLGTDRPRRSQNPKVQCKKGEQMVGGPQLRSRRTWCLHSPLQGTVRMTQPQGRELSGRTVCCAIQSKPTSALSPATVSKLLYCTVLYVRTYLGRQASQGPGSAESNLVPCQPPSMSSNHDKAHTSLCMAHGLTTSI